MNSIKRWWTEEDKWVRRAIVANLALTGPVILLSIWLVP